MSSEHRAKRRILAGLFIAAILVVQALASEQAKTVTAELRQAYAQLNEARHHGLISQPSQATFPRAGSLLWIASDQYSPRAVDVSQNDSSNGDSRKHADALFALAKRAAEAGQLSLAFQWVTEALHENPDHAEARRVLGYEQRDGKWLTEYGVRMADARQPKAWHPKFAWIAPSDVARYEAGERLVDGRWVSAEVDAGRRGSIEDGWVVRTDHFLVRTNHSLEAGAELAARLERLHQVWRQLFAGFYLSEREIRELFAGRRQPRRVSQPMRVWYYRTKEEYVAALTKWQPRIAETLGIYFDDRREAHFYAAAETNTATLYHEAVHQLFQETGPSARRVGSLANFWIIEGVATYFETLTEHLDPQAGRRYTIGEATSGRLPAAHRRLHEGYYVSLAELTTLGKDDLQRRADLQQVYSQMAGLTAFLMDAEGGRYREPLVRFLGDVYSGRDSPDSLTKATGLSFEELDAAYRRHMTSLPD
jgi:hypothetical protein